LNDNLQGIDRLLTTPKVIHDATKEYKSEMDRIKSWMDECCDLKSYPYRETRASELYQPYRLWAKDSGEWGMNQRIFGNKLVERGYQKKRTAKGNVYIGITITYQ